MNQGLWNIPESWALSRIDRVATVSARIGWKALTASEYQPVGYAFLATPNIKSKEIDFENVNYISEFRYEESPNLKLAVDDVLLAKDGNTLGICNIVRDLPREATVNGSIAVIRTSEVEANFLRYVLSSSLVQDHIDSVKDGMGVPHLFQRDIKRIPVPLPSIEEQRLIADFLDFEVDRIEHLLVARRRQVELLTLRRERVVEQNLLLGGSCEIDRMIPLKYLVDRVSVGIVITPAAWYVENSGVPALRGVNIRPGGIVLNDMVHISNEGHALHQKSRLSSGDLVVVRTGQAGVAAVVPDELDGANCIDLVIIKTGGKINSSYLEYMLNSEYARRRVNEYSVGSIQSHFNVSAMKSMPVPVLDLEQQMRVVEELDRNVGVINELKGGVLRQIKLLEERKRALITAAVTGQIDVATARGADLS